MLVDWTQDGLGAVSMEASSIGIAVGRLHGTQIKTAAFTNLTRDHLDFHPDFESYAQAKATLFAWPGLASVVVNCDDAMADRMLEAVPSHVQRIGYRIDSKRRGVQASERVDAWLRVERIETLDSGGYRIEIDGDWGRGSVNLRAPGRFNISNALAVAGSALANGMGFEQVLVGLAKLSPVPGRMESLTERDSPLVVIDYAHTPDALIQVLGALRPIAKVRGGRLHCIFGAGGDRDTGKRALMGEAVAQHADTLMITTDNPRSEDPAQIVRAILEGVARVPSANGAQVDHDRRRAIQQVIGAAEAADVILIAGKGHESVQEIAGQQLPFRDVDEARLALSQRSDRAA
jgi:UDP-N-acetylmuramoyl-L-alanyl-D-glutamate--2,6-diaminopimelate ligase